MNRWILGVDFGQRNDRTALAGIEVVPNTETPTAKPFFDVRYLDRLRVGISYVDQVAHIASLLRATAEFADAEVVVDGTGVGVAVSDMCREQFPCSFTELTITAGQATSMVGRKASVPKRDLTTGLAVAMQGRRLRVAPGLAEAQTFYRELESFEVSITDSGSDVYGARHGHDDLVLAVSYAVWKADRRGQGGAFMDAWRQLVANDRARVLST